MTASSSTGHKATRKSVKSRRAKSRRARGQQVIAAERAREIQQALIRAKYLDGDASGVWDTRTKAAMARFQADHGWQTKVIPDSRAIIKLGLGPTHKDLFSPERTAISQPAFGSESDTSTSGQPQQHF